MKAGFTFSTPNPLKRIGGFILSATPKSLKIIPAIGELRTHRLLLSRLEQALATKDFSLTVIFPTLSLLNFIQDQLLNRPGVHGIGGVRFFLFEGFIGEIVERFGLKQRLPSLLERNLLITQCFQELMAEGKMGYLNRAPFTASYRQAILQGIAEWERDRLTPEIFRQWAEGRGGKEQELALLYQSYQELLARYGYSGADMTLTELQDQLGRLILQQPAPVLLYGFTDLTPLQNAFIHGLRGSFDFEIILDPTQVDIFQELSAHYFHIAWVSDDWKPNGEKTSLGNSESTQPDPRDALSRLQDYFWSREPRIISLDPGDQSLGLIQTAGVIRQATGIAREVAALWKANPALEPGDFLIVAPDPAGFLRTAAPVFKEYRLPLVKPKRPVTEFPWVDQLSNLLAAASTDWQWPDLEVLIRQYYRGDATAGDRLLFMIGDRYGALSGRERWLKIAGGESFRQYFLEMGFDLEPLSQAIRHLAGIPLRAPLNVYLQAIRELIAGYARPAAMLNTGGAAGADDRSRETGPPIASEASGWLLNFRAVQLIQRSFDQWLDFLERTPEPQTEIDIAEFLTLFDDYLLRCSDLEVEPPATSQPGIRVLPPREARGLKARIVFITGLEQGVFPRAYINDWKVDSSGRFELKKRGIELETGAHYYIQEKWAFYWSLQSAATKLYLVCQDQDSGGQPLNRSIFLDEVLEWVPDLAARLQHYPLAPGLPETLAQCYSGYELRSYSARFLGRDPAEFQALDRSGCETLLRLVSYRQLMGRIRSRKLRQAGPVAPLFADPASLQLIAKMFGPDHVFAITALEDYRSCPYRFFGRRLLNVQPVLKPELTPSALDLGSLYHQILESFGDAYRDSDLLPEEISVYRRLLEELFRSYYREWQENAATDLAQLMLLLQENSIRRNLAHWLDMELQWAAATRNRFHIKYLELAFGMVKGDQDPASLPHPYQLGEGPDRVKLWGKIDRVDADAKGHFLVYDYKSGRGPSVKEIMKAGYLQLPVYIMAMEQLLFGPNTTVGGSYLGMKAPSRIRGGVWRRSQMAALTGAGVLEEAEWQNWLNEVQSVIIDVVKAIRSGEFHRVGEECLSFCEFRDVCRREGWEVDRTDGLSVESATN
jgi:ATP-dependent helicase/DNAse subunit B